MKYSHYWRLALGSFVVLLLSMQAASASVNTSTLSVRSSPSTPQPPPPQPSALSSNFPLLDKRKETDGNDTSSSIQGDNHHETLNSSSNSTEAASSKENKHQSNTPSNENKRQEEFSSSSSGASEPTSPPPTKSTSIILGSYRDTCLNFPTVRKEVREMKEDGDLDSYISAFKQSANDGLLAKFAEIHRDYWFYAHSNYSFMAWHRVYVKEFEVQLMKRGAKYIPYWDWTVDSQEPWTSIIFTNDFFGRPDPNKNHQVVTSDFAAGKYSEPIGGLPLVRVFNPDGPTDPFWHMTHVDNIIKTNNDYSSFAKAIEEGPHAAVHSIIGGDEKLGHMSSWRSPLDPIFWLHHAFIDKLFYTWQQRGKSPRFDGREYGYKGVDETHIIKPFRVPAKLILDLENTCTNYQDIPQNLLDRIQTKHFDSIRAPKAPKNWMNGSDVDAAKKLLDEAANLTETVNEMIKNKTLDPDKVINVDDFLGENMKPTVKDKKKRNGECTTVIYSYVSAFLMAIAMLSMSVV